MDPAHDRNAGNFSFYVLHFKHNINYKTIRHYGFFVVLHNYNSLCTKRTYKNSYCKKDEIF